MRKNSSSEQKTNSALYKTTLVLAKIAEILHWWLAGAMLVGGIIAVVNPTFIMNLAKSTISNYSALSCYGFEIANAGADMLTHFAFGSAIVLALMAMIFRNVYLILKAAKGKTWFAKGSTPFQSNIVRMFREIGVFFIAVSAMSLVSGIIAIFTSGELCSGFNYLSCFIGLVFLCISQFFNYGASLEKDLDGLV